MSTRVLTTDTKAKVLALVALALVIAVLYVWMFSVLMQSLPTRQDAPKQVQPTTTQPATAEPAADTNTPALPAIADPAAPVIKNSYAQAPATADSGDSTDTRTDLLTSAGIASSDQPIALSLMFDGSGWNLSSSFVGERAMHMSDELSRARAVNYYVVTSYETWSAAKAHADANGGRW